MRALLWPALAATIVLTVLTGIIYPVAITGISEVAFPHQAGGSLITRSGKAVGSELLGQYADDAKYFWGRISATGPMPYNGASSNASNLGPSNPALLDAIKGRIAALRAVDSSNTAPVPVDLVTSSASGLDPHISPAAAAYQVARVARARGLDSATVAGLVARHTQGRQLGFLGEARVNVLLLNLDLDQLTAKP
jgi:K+-transporting ATPase ATPase C chain